LFQVKASTSVLVHLSGGDGLLVLAATGFGLVGAGSSSLTDIPRQSAAATASRSSAVATLAGPSDVADATW